MVAEEILVALCTMDGPESTRSATNAAHQLRRGDGFEVLSCEDLSNGFCFSAPDDREPSGGEALLAA